MATLAGKTLGKYRVIERLGRGGMADVYKGHHPRLDRHVAIKVLHGHLAEGEDFLARFEREAKAVAALRHPHVVQVYDFDVEDDLYYMVMEYVDGGTLKDRLQELARTNEYLPLAEAGRIFCEVARALDYAHGQGMIHRDVKPANVLLNQAGRAFLTDFGIAHILSSGTQFTATGTLIGTPAYMSPEQGRGQRLTKASDIYSLGVILYELATGRVPYEADTPLAIIHQHIHEPLPAPRTFRPDLDEGLERVILRALAKEPGDRYQAAAEMGQAVEGALASAATQAARVDEGPTQVWQPDAGETEAPTVAMEEEPAPPPAAVEEAVTMADETAAPTVAMEEEPPPAEPAPPEPVAAPKPRREVSPRAKRRISPVVLGAGGLAVIVVLAVVVSQLLGGGSACGSIEECRVMAEGLAGEGDAWGAIEMIDAALDQVSGGERSAYAELWCWQGDLKLEVGDVDSAIASFENCLSWAGDEPDMEWLRTNAQERIRELEGR